MRTRARATLATVVLVSSLAGCGAYDPPCRASEPVALPMAWAARQGARAGAPLGSTTLHRLEGGRLLALRARTSTVPSLGGGLADLLSRPAHVDVAVLDGSDVVLTASITLPAPPRPTPLSTAGARSIAWTGDGVALVDEVRTPTVATSSSSPGGPWPQPTTISELAYRHVGLDGTASPPLMLEDTRCFGCARTTMLVAREDRVHLVVSEGATLGGLTGALEARWIVLSSHGERLGAGRVEGFVRGRPLAIEGTAAGVVLRVGDHVSVIDETFTPVSRPITIADDAAGVVRFSSDLQHAAFVSWRTSLTGAPSGAIDGLFVSEYSSERRTRAPLRISTGLPREVELEPDRLAVLFRDPIPFYLAVVDRAEPLEKIGGDLPIVGPDAVTPSEASIVARGDHSYLVYTASPEGVALGEVRCAP